MKDLFFFLFFIFEDGVAVQAGWGLLLWGWHLLVGLSRLFPLLLTLVLLSFLLVVGVLVVSLDRFLWNYLVLVLLSVIIHLEILSTLTTNTPQILMPHLFHFYSPQYCTPVAKTNELPVKRAWGVIITLNKFNEIKLEKCNSTNKS